ALRHLVRLNVAIVILAGPDELAAPFERACDHVVDQAMLIFYPSFFELSLELAVENFLEYVLETTIISLEDRVLGRQVNGPFAGEAIVQAGAREIADRFIEIVHSHGDACIGEVEYFLLDSLAI